MELDILDLNEFSFSCGLVADKKIHEEKKIGKSYICELLKLVPSRPPLSS
jgi:hypothetical protein